MTTRWLTSLTLLIAALSLSAPGAAADPFPICWTDYDCVADPVLDAGLGPGWYCYATGLEEIASASVTPYQSPSADWFLDVNVPGSNVDLICSNGADLTYSQSWSIAGTSYQIPIGDAGYVGDGQRTLDGVISIGHSSSSAPRIGTTTNRVDTDFHAVCIVTESVGTIVVAGVPFVCSASVSAMAVACWGPPSWARKLGMGDICGWGGASSSMGVGGFTTGTIAYNDVVNGGAHTWFCAHGQFGANCGDFPVMSGWGVDFQLRQGTTYCKTASAAGTDVPTLLGIPIPVAPAKSSAFVRPCITAP